MRRMLSIQQLRAVQQDAEEMSAGYGPASDPPLGIDEEDPFAIPKKPAQSEGDPKPKKPVQSEPKPRTAEEIKDYYRNRKATLMVEKLKERSYTVERVLQFSEEEWNDLALAAECNPPGSQTCKDMIIRMLLERKDAL